MPTLGSRDNAGNLENLVSGVIHFTLGLGFLDLHQRLMIDSICVILIQSVPCGPLLEQPCSAPDKKG